jgi:uncharacterized protein YraI
MKRNIITVATGILALVLGACGASTQGPSTWLDRPLEGDRVPLATLKIQAHASDAEGVFKIEFYVANAHIAQDMTGGHRLVQANIEWMPPAPGAYIIKARAIDTQGNIGPYASVSIIVEGAAQPTSVPSPTQVILTPEPRATATPTEAKGPVLTATLDTNCRAGPGKVYAVVDALPKGKTAAIDGRNAEGSWFRIILFGSTHCWVSTMSVAIQGDVNKVAVLAAPVLTATPQVQAPPLDTTPPVISNVSINPTSIEQQGCGSPDSFTISATVTDASGIGNVTYELHGPGPADGGEGYLLPGGGDSYQATVGPIAGSTGNWSVRISAVDMANNTAHAGPWTIQIMCIQ